MLIYIYIVAIFTFYYAYIMRRYYKGWQDLSYWTIPKHHSFTTKVSVLIAARNEEKSIEKCVRSIVAQDFPQELLEIIVIDDHSTDRTVEIVENLSITNLRLLKLEDFMPSHETQGFKRKAVEIGTAQAKGELISMTDADCIAHPDWLKNVVSYYEIHQPKFIGAPVNFHEEESRFERFQSLDFLGMMLITGGSIQAKLMNMCNGANLSYPKAVFKAINGFEGDDKLETGEDMLLMQKIADKYPNEIAYIKNEKACTYTKGEPTIRRFFNQRVRWATKGDSHRDWHMLFMLAMVLGFCTSVPFSLLLTLFFGWKMLLVVAVQLIIKLIVDYFFMRSACSFFKREDLMSIFFYASIAHLVYIVTVGIWGNLAKEYEWKGRMVR